MTNKDVLPSSRMKIHVLSDSFEIVLKAIHGDMRVVRAEYMRLWINWAKDGHIKEDPTRAKPAIVVHANKAWMNSEIRAQIMAARQNRQY